MIIGKKEFDVKNKTYVMGILNVTPDSFSDGGKWNNVDIAQKRIEEMLEQGMDILDIGAESTRPGYTLLDDETEIIRLLPIVKMAKQKFDIPVSVDTYKSKVALAVLEEGVDLINDIWGLKYDKELANVIAKYNVPCCLMHNRDNTNYNVFIDDMINDLRQSLLIAEKANINKDKIILDPGVGFAKSYENNLEAVSSLEKMHVLDCPILLGTSRKSFIGTALDATVTERLEGTLATTIFAVQKGASFVRVHDILENKKAIKMTEILLNK